MSWYLDVLRKYAQFDGRSRRMEYWMFTLINIVIGMAIGFVGGTLHIGTAWGINFLAAVYWIATIIPSVAVSIRRLHDTGRTGWWLLIGFVPFLGFILLVIFALFESDVGTNEYGANPKTAIA